MRKVRGAGIAMIFQEPMTALNPLRTIGDQIGEMFEIHTELSKAEIKARVLALLQDVHIPDPAQAARAYPHELSGGQRQRAMIAMALALDPRLLIADEPTTALDVTTQAQILKLIKELQSRRNTAVLFITHDFGVVAEIADRVVVMQHGNVVEQGAVKDVLTESAASLYAAADRRGAAADGAAAARTVRRHHPDARQRVEDLSQWRLSRTRRACDPCGEVRLPETATRCDARHCRRVRFGQIDAGPLHHQADRSRWRRDRAGRQGLGEAHARRGAPRDQAHPDGVSGPVRLAEPAPQGRRPRGARPDRARYAACRGDSGTAKELFRLVGLDPSAIDRFPHEFSGGQRQRIGLARALALKPDVLVADEAVSALDVSVQAQVLKMLHELRERLGLSIVFITHDLRVAAQICDLVAVMKDGEVVEHGLAGEVFGNPQHAYTQALLASIPGGDFARSRKPVTV
jgi:peptide/nickel transport system ATP-binding protein